MHVFKTNMCKHYSTYVCEGKENGNIKIGFFHTAPIRRKHIDIYTIHHVVV